MKRTLSGRVKKLTCLAFAAVLAFSMVLTGCNKKDIESEAQEEELAQDADKDTLRMLQVVYTKVDKAKLTVKKLEDIHSKNEKAFLSDNLTEVPVTLSKERDGMYEAEVDSKEVNGVPGKLVDYEFYSDKKTDGAEFDAKKGIVYIPKALIDKSDSGHAIGIQLMMAVDVKDDK